MGILSLKVFGRFSATYKQQPIQKLRTNKARALLVFLALENKYPHEREKLIDLLWPGLPLKSAQANLRQLTYQIKTAFPEIDQKNSDGEAVQLILSAQGQMRVNPEAAVEIDVLAFEQTLDAVFKHEHSSLMACDRCFDALSGITTHIAGELLEDISVPDSNVFEEWRVVKRETFQRQLLDALGVLGKIHLARGQYGSAETVARRQLSLDEYRERAHRQLLEALARNGRRNEAIAHYEQMVTLFQSALAIQPARKTSQLAQAIAADELDVESVNTAPVRGYELLEQLGEGSFGSVHRAYQPLVDREVAVKIIKAEYANRPNFIRLCWQP